MSLKSVDMENNVDNETRSHMKQSQPSRLVTQPTRAALASPKVMAGSLVAASLLALSGCATTPTLSPQQCQNGDWRDIGYVDGTRGRSPNYFGEHMAECTGVAGSQPNRQLWEEGRQEGLKSYCTELTAYKLGREGYDWQAVCPLENIEVLEEAYREGRYYYLRERDLDYMMGSPWGYGPYGYRGWGGPYWRPYW